jgi:tetratricopeptide (TPR) repeat protein
MEPLSRADQLCLDAAEGWLGLGNHVEAFTELEQVSGEMQQHPDVLRMRYNLYAAAKNWAAAVETAQSLCQLADEEPFGPIHLAYALHELKRTKEAWDVLLPVATRFPDEYIVRYNLACYACQMGNLPTARQWLERAVEIAGLDLIRKMALQDADLEPLWPEIKSWQTV